MWGIIAEDLPEEANRVVLDQTGLKTVFHATRCGADRAAMSPRAACLFAGAR